MKGLDSVFRDMQPFCGMYKLRGCLDVQICCICVMSRGGGGEYKVVYIIMQKRPLPTHIPCVNLWDNYILGQLQDTQLTKGHIRVSPLFKLSIPRVYTRNSSTILAF